MKSLIATALCILFLSPAAALADASSDPGKTPVTVGNFVRAESDHMLRANMASFGVGVGGIHHVREATTPEVQPVIRMNQDTLYSGGVLDLTEPVTITLPDLGGRYQSLHVVNQDHYMYVIASVDQNDGEAHYALTAKDVPVDAFWSVTVYNADGYLEANSLGVNSYNDVTAEPGPDGSVTVHFGGCEDGPLNCIPITTGWNYAVRMYSPRKELLNGTWAFPIPRKLGS